LKFFLIVVCLLVVGTAPAQQPLTKFDISPQGPSYRPLDIASIRATLQNSLVLRGFDLTQAQIVPPADFTTRTPTPRLELRHIAESPGGEALFVTLRCQERKQCGSFLAQVVLPSATANPRAAKELEGLHRTSSSTVIGTSTAPALVQPHIAAQLVIEEDGLQISELVLPRKRAALGEVVPVRDPRTHRSMLAEVVGPGLLRPVKETKQGQQQNTP
jgi:hypothetical protein